jgi:predicted enzyme related to lactoylglutathione lyase
MERVTGIGGIFFKCDNPQAQNEWYKKHLGFNISENSGGIFNWRDAEHPDKECYTVWSTFKNDSPYFNPSEKSYMINYRVENLAELLKILKEEGVQVIGDIEEYEYGKFGWIMDPEGNKIELWEPSEEKSGA